jgi:uncharacterized Zn-binding protein involved in type VI secretion
MPPAARITDAHVCPKVDPPPHVGGPVKTGEETVIICFQPAARVGDLAICNGPPDTISKGEPSVIIGGQDAARRGDPTAHGGRITSGCPTVNIGSSAQADALQTDKPFCEECAKKQQGGG